MIELKDDDFFTSDQHYGHKNCIKYCRRPFAANMDFPTPEEVTTMNEFMVKAYNEVVDGRRCFHVGDFSLALGWVDSYGPRLIGEKLLIPGNHDWCHPMYIRKKQKIEAARRRFTNVGFNILDTTVNMMYDGLKFKVSHLPYWGIPESVEDDGYKGRYKELRPVVEDEDVLICGHVHNAWKIRRLPDGTFMYNVGVDQHDFKPVSIKDIVRSIKEFV